MHIDIEGKLLKDIDLVIFDRDGTLIDLYAYWSWMVGQRATLLCQRLGLDEAQRIQLMFAMGIDKQNRLIRPQGPVGLRKREVVMQAAVDCLYGQGYKDKSVSGLCFEIFREVDNLSIMNLDAIIKPIPGLFELFNTLGEHSCKIAIATTDKTARAKIVMDFLHLSEKTDFIAGEDAVDNPKPAADMVYLILDALNVDKSKAVMVGDATVDIEMGINAGLKASIGVLNGLSKKNDLVKLTPYVVKSINDIKIISGGINERD